MKLNEYDIAAIRGCVLNGASAEQIYAAFGGAYDMDDIKKIIKELTKQKNGKGSSNKLVFRQLEWWN